MTDVPSGGSRRVSPIARAMRVAWVWGPAVALMVAIFVLSGIGDLGALPGDISDKTGHFWAYFLLGALVLRGVARARWRGVTFRTAAAAWAIAVSFGASDEWHQSFVPGRTMAIDDWVADAAGAAVAVSIGWIAARLVCREDRTV